ncbi:ferritin-like domain-containing protein [Nonomuraea sp. NPDC049158]|uniref:ferritin-like domain-containing protein n=1 Tax=Nonomuraea sp. NPDC049158 TaxID=3155649 RepID=UPI0033CB42CB
MKKGADVTAWVAEFEAAAERRRTDGDPDWGRGACLHRAVMASIQRFQVGESGDGAGLIGKADRAGDGTGLIGEADKAENDAYSAAVRLFVAEEQNHARLLAHLLAAAGAPTLAGHRSDTAFVRLRRMLGLRLELMVLMIAEVIALRYYRALRDGAGDPLATDVAARILADEQRHVPFHCGRLSRSFRHLPTARRAVLAGGWWCLMLGTVTVVAVDHGLALRCLGLSRSRFVRDVLTLFGGAVSASVR